MAATANAGRAPRPVGLKLLEGRSPGRDSGGRVIKTPPSFVRVPPPKPEGLSPDAEVLWDRVVAELPRVHLLKDLDGPGLQIGCETFARWCEARRMRQEKGLTHVGSHGEVAAPWVGIEERASREFRAWCAEFGLTPAAEMKVAKSEVGESDGDDPFA